MFAPAGLRSAGSPAEGRPDAPRSGGEAAVWAVFALLGTLIAGYLGYLLLRRSDEFSAVVDGWPVVGIEAVAGSLCVLAGVRRPDRRAPAIAFGLSCLMWACGDLVLTFESLGGADPPTPSLADAFYLGFFPFALAGVALFVRRELGGRRAPGWVDAGVVALGMAAVCAGFAFRGLEHLLASPTLAQATDFAYPLGDLLLLGLAAGSVVLAGPGRASLVAIAVALAIIAVGDTINFAGVADRYESVVDAVAWPTTIVLISASMWLRERPREWLGLESLATVALPAALTFASLAILVAGSWHRFGPLAIALASVTLVLAGVRLAFRPALALARERARSSEERYQHLFEQHPQPTVAYDRETLRIVAASDAMVRHYGYSRAELHEMSIFDIVVAEDHAMLRSYLGATPAGSRPEYRLHRPDYPGRHRLADGSLIDVDVTSTNIELDGRACRIAHFDDVTDRRRAAAELAQARDQAVEASNMKSAFLANVSHEIRTPMNGVLGMTDVLLAMGLSDEQRECAQQVARSGEQMLAIVNDILDISKIETGHLELDLADFDLGAAIGETCAAAAALAKLKGLGLAVEIADEVPRRAHGDGRRLQQVLANLISNAVKFTPAGSVTVAVSAWPAGPGATWVLFEVTDTGIGIDPGDIDRMFEPFTQADASMTRVYGGTGLGLAIARELVELMGGRIGAESVPSQGSTFGFQVVLRAPREQSAGDRAPVAPAATRWVTPPLVLVADDSQINQIVATRALERCGCRARAAGDGLAALEALAAEQFDVVLMDCQMPGMDGFQVTAELRRRERDGRRTPVIAMTAHAMDGDRRRCLDAGMDDYISKPMRHAELAELLGRWIPARPAAGSASGRRRGADEQRAGPLARQPVERRQLAGALRETAHERVGRAEP